MRFHKCLGANLGQALQTPPAYIKVRMRSPEVLIDFNPVDRYSPSLLQLSSQLLSSLRSSSPRLPVPCRRHVNISSLPSHWHRPRKNSSVSRLRSTRPSTTQIITARLESSEMLRVQNSPVNSPISSMFPSSLMLAALSTPLQTRPIAARFGH